MSFTVCRHGEINCENVESVVLDYLVYCSKCRPPVPMEHHCCHRCCPRCGAYEVERCKHCGIRILEPKNRSKGFVHATGPQAGMHTCAISPYGFHAEPEGAPCSGSPANPCNGARGLVPNAEQA